jgi:hypothetical protein
VKEERRLACKGNVGGRKEVSARKASTSIDGRERNENRWRKQ